MARFVVSIVAPPGQSHHETFREVAESIHFALLELGHESRLALNDLGEKGFETPILLGWNLLEPFGMVGWDLSRAILYNLEQAGSPWLEPIRLGPLVKALAVWTWDLDTMRELADKGIGARVLPVGYVRQLERLVLSPAPDLDVLFYGSLSDRRTRVLEDLERRGLRVQHLFGVYGTERDRAIERARLVLNLHYRETSRFEWVRVSYLLANAVCVVSELSASSVALSMADPRALAWAPYDKLVSRCMMLAGDPEVCRRYGEHGRELMRRRPLAPELARLL